ncbi:hypothetical protein [Microbulbifer sp. JMSA008]|uniref:hypothetical protein n=1 Tax=Microbulbifer sp. JMSA008 TaxID=3243373 RepID=UPI00403917A2
MRVTLRAIGVFGLLLFGTLFSVTFGMPTAVEKSAKDFVAMQIESEIEEKYQDSKVSSLSDKALSIASRLGYEESKIRADLNNKLPEKIASVIASLCGYDCEKKKSLTKSIAAGYMERIANLQVAQEKLGEIIKNKYMTIVESLRTDLRIFLGSNTVMFMILLLVSFQKPKAMAHLFLPGIFLLSATTASSAIYLFGQDCFYTILYNDYMGFGYLVYVSVIFGFLMDVTFNQARVTSEIINAFFNAVGSTLSVAPC